MSQLPTITPKMLQIMRAQQEAARQHFMNSRPKPIRTPTAFELRVFNHARKRL